MDKKDYYSSLKNDAKEWVNCQQLEIYRALKEWFACVFLALLFPFLSIFVADTTTNMDQWFQRSGTLLLVFSLLAEIKAQAVRKYIFVVNGNLLFCHLHIEQKNKSWMPFVQYFTYILVAIGTLITGYGDILFNRVYGA
ncbi:hypothetical protein [Vibrio hibernica]|uniref:hypothetical protein n=1 Tax=Vibrio hibernica TaxID=2587465 RepID=UPI001882D83E|nr:hypothetical protein [Vibrio hibernica]